MDSEVEYNLSKFADGTKLCGAVNMLKARNGHVLVRPRLQGHTQPSKVACKLRGKPGSARQRERLGPCATPVRSWAFTIRENTLSKGKVKQLHFTLQPPRVGKDIENSGTRGPASAALPCIPFHTCCWPLGLRLSGCCSAMRVMEAILSTTRLSTVSLVTKICHNLLRDTRPLQALSRKLK